MLKSLSIETCFKLFLLKLLSLNSVTVFYQMHLYITNLKQLQTGPKLQITILVIFL